MKTAHDYMLEAFGPEWSGKVWDMDRLKAKVERAITEAIEAECAAIANDIEKIASAWSLRPVEEPIPVTSNLLTIVAKGIRARTPAKGDEK